MDLLLGRKEQRSSDSTKGLPCDGKPCFTVITSGKRIKRERYWCSKSRSFIDPHAVDCPGACEASSQKSSML